jgi:hypothetical protein
VSAQSVTILVGIAGLILGWLVGGYQRITEKLIEERRDALAKVLEAADSIRISGAHASPVRSNNCM